MLKKIVSLIAVLLSIHSFSQVLYSERFNALSLNTATYTSNSSIQTYLYADVPANMFTINNGNLVADTLTGNYPFRATGQKLKAWLSYKPANVADTFAVSTSWVTPAGTSTDAWLITPTISNITANTVLTWDALAPDLSNLDGYEVYVTTNISSSPVVGDFSVGNRIYSTGAENASWTAHGISLASYAGQNIRIGFRNNSQNKYQLWIDDILVTNIPNAYDMASYSGDTYKYSTINTNNVISASFKNNGSAAATSLVLNYQVGNNAVVSETQNLASPMNYLDTKQFTFSTLYISGTPSYDVVKVWISSINGQADQLNGNDTAKSSLTLSTAIPNKKVLVEQFTTVKNGGCADAYISIRDIALANNNVIVAAVHSNDNLSVASGTALTNSITNRFPSAAIDRYNYPGVGPAVSRADWNTYIIQRQSMKVPVDVSVTGVSYNTATREISATVSANFVGDVKGDYRLNLYVKENNIYGPIMDNTDNSWNQYSSSHNIQGSPYYQVGIYLNPNTYVLGPNQFSHQYVVNEFLDGAYGAAGIIPANGSTVGQTYTKAYTYTVPIAAGGEFRFNPDNIYLIGVVTENSTSTGTILNAREVKLTANAEIPVGINESAVVEKASLNVYPNPATGTFYLNYTSTQSQWIRVDLYNTLGEMVHTQTEFVNQGNVTQQLDCSRFAEGNYHIVVSFKDNAINKKLTIIK